jgi:hypothetical protein
MPTADGRWTDEEVCRESDRLHFINGLSKPAEITVREIAESLITGKDGDHMGIGVHVPFVRVRGHGPRGWGDIYIERWRIPEPHDGAGRLVLEAQIYTQLRAGGWRF